MILTPENYHSPEANMHYMSVSQYKHWIECPAATLANLKGEYEPEDKTALLVGQYVHAWSEGTLEQFKCDHPEIISSKGATKGELKAEFKKADEMISVMQDDPKVMFYLQGHKEVILTAEMFGTPWKIKIDVDNPGLNYLLDIKTTKSISEGGWVRQDGKNIKVSFIEEWGYMIQAAVYSEVERIARGREAHRDFLVVAVSKEKVPDHAIIDLTDPGRIQEELDKIKANMSTILAVKSGNEAPERCECCDYCKMTKKVSKIIHYSELMPA